jgi:hypothetical protein
VFDALIDIFFPCSQVSFLNPFKFQTFMVSNAPFGDRQPVREEVFSSLDEIAKYSGPDAPSHKAVILQAFENAKVWGSALRILRQRDGQFAVGIYTGLPDRLYGVHREHIIPSYYPNDPGYRLFPGFECLMNERQFAWVTNCGLSGRDWGDVPHHSTLALTRFMEEILREGMGDALVAAYPGINRADEEISHTSIDVYAGWVQMPQRPRFRGREQAINPHEYLGPGFPGDVCDPNRV